MPLEGPQGSVISLQSFGFFFGYQISASGFIEAYEYEDRPPEYIPGGTVEYIAAELGHIPEDVVCV
jgi:hypothetical protein